MMSREESNLNVSIEISLDEIELSLDTVAEISGHGKDEFSESSNKEVRAEEGVEQECKEEIVNSDQPESLSSAQGNDNEVEGSKDVGEEPTIVKSLLEEDKNDDVSAPQKPVIPSDVITLIEDEPTNDEVHDDQAKAEPTNDEVHDEQAKAEIEDENVQEEVQSERIFMEEKALQKVSKEGKVDETKDSNKVVNELVETESETESDVTEENEPFPYKAGMEQATESFVLKQDVEKTHINEFIVENDNKTRAKHNIGFLLKLAIISFCFSISIEVLRTNQRFTGSNHKIHFKLINVENGTIGFPSNIAESQALEMMKENVKEFYDGSVQAANEFNAEFDSVKRNLITFYQDTVHETNVLLSNSVIATYEVLSPRVLDWKNSFEDGATRISTSVLTQTQRLHEIEIKMFIMKSLKTMKLNAFEIIQDLETFLKTEDSIVEKISWFIKDERRQLIKLIKSEGFNAMFKEEPMIVCGKLAADFDVDSIGKLCSAMKVRKFKKYLNQVHLVKKNATPRQLKLKLKEVCENN